MPERQDISTGLRFAAVGDLLLAAGHAGRGAAEALARLRRELGDCDILLGNLECTMPGDGETVPTEPRVIASPEMVHGLGDIGFHVVSLANNHMFDCLEEGFLRLRDELDAMGIAWFGAGLSLEEAAAPAIVEAKGVRLAFLGFADQRSGARHFASEDHWGVAPLQMEAILDRIRGLKRDVDHVIVSPHWGEERLLIPAPRQIDQARAFVDAGASMVLGHHPHVIQGLEVHAGAPIVYSLGNFIANEVPYANGDVLRWNRAERIGCLLTATFTHDAVEDVRQQPTFDSGKEVAAETTGFGGRRIDKANRALNRGVSLGRYRWEHFWVRTVRPTIDHLRWSKLKRLRFRNLRNALRSLASAKKAE